MEYDDDLRLESAVLYYHTSEDEKRRMFPADPDAGRTNITSSNATSRRVDIRSNITARDSVCVLTGVEEFIHDAAHLLPHSKGDQVCYCCSVCVPAHCVAVHRDLYFALQLRCCQ